MKVIERGEWLWTTQMCLLNEVKDYDTIIIEYIDRTIVITNNHDGTYDCPNTDKEIRWAHNFFKMWENGAFDD